jgi:hypothetical protein
VIVRCCRGRQSRATGAGEAVGCFCFRPWLRGRLLPGGNSRRSSAPFGEQFRRLHHLYQHRADHSLASIGTAAGLVPPPTARFGRLPGHDSSDSKAIDRNQATGSIDVGGSGQTGSPGAPQDGAVVALMWPSALAAAARTWWHGLHGDLVGHCDQGEQHRRTERNAVTAAGPRSPLRRSRRAGPRADPIRSTIRRTRTARDTRPVRRRGPGCRR